MAAKSATVWGTRRRVMSSVVIPSADSWRMSSLVSRVIGLSAPGVGGIVVLRALVGDGVGTVVSESVRGRRKCFRIRQWMEVDGGGCMALCRFVVALHYTQKI